MVSVGRGTSEPAIGVYNGNQYPSLTRICFMAPTRSYYSFPIELGTLPADYTISCTETTLFGGFNTSVTDFNFLELTNTLDGPAETETIKARIFARDSVSQQTIIHNSVVQIPPGDRRDVDIHSVAGAGAFGPLFVTHDGPPGSLKATVSQYNITSTNPLVFVPVARQELESRSDIARVTRKITAVFGSELILL